MYQSFFTELLVNLDIIFFFHCLRLVHSVFYYFLERICYYM